MFIHDFIVQFAVRLERVVLRQPPWELEVANCDLKDAFSSAVSAAQRKSHAIQIEWLAAFGCRLLYKGLQFGARRRLVDDLLPAIVIHLRELT